MNKKEKKKREKHMSGFMTAKSTAELAEEMKKDLDLEIPDPEEVPDYLRSPTLQETRANEERFIDTVDARERSRLRHEGTERGQ